MTVKLPFNLPHFIRKRVARDVRQGTVFILTPLGKQKANSFGLDGVKFDVLCELAESGPSTIAEISNGTGISDQHTKAIIKVLTRSGYVRVASDEG